MKKKSIFFTILGSCFGLGIVLIIIGIILGGRIRTLAIGPTHTPKKGVSTELPNISLTDTTDIQKIDLNLSASRINIRCGDSFGVQGSYLSKNEVSDGTWTVESSLNDHFYQVDIFGVLKIPVPRRYYKNTTDTITITIPKNVTLDDMEFELSGSDVTIEEINCIDVDLEVSAGQVTIDSINANYADMSVSAGDITIQQYNITESASVECNAGNINFGARKFSEENFCNNLEAECSMGNIDVFGKLTGNGELECNMGDITLNLVGSQANYDVLSDTSLGDISHVTKNFLKKSGEKGGVSFSDDNSKYGTLDLSCSLGSITVYYLYGTEGTSDAK